MLCLAEAIVAAVLTERPGVQILAAEDVGGHVHKALLYTALMRAAQVGDTVVVNTTARLLNLGTGGYDFVTAVLPGSSGASQTSEPGHMMKVRYTPAQHSVHALEEVAEYRSVWDRDMENIPVLVGQLHSQVLPAAAALHGHGCSRVAYVMTDAGALSAAFSTTIPEAKERGFLQHVLTCGQAFGGDSETITLHSALLAARHVFNADAVIVCQGPGNAGTGTRTGFGGIEMAQNLDIAARLGGRPFAIARCSGADARPRHRGISHHTLTALAFAYAPVTIALPRGTAAEGIGGQHVVTWVPDSGDVCASLLQDGVILRSMGRMYHDDPLFFDAAAAAGIAAASTRRSYGT